MTKTITKKLLACLPVGMAFIIMMMISFTFVNAQQPCNGNKVEYYKCKNNHGGHLPSCNSRCVDPNNPPNGWLPFCPCFSARLANEPGVGELFTLDVSPNPVSGSSVIYFFIEQSQKVSLKIFDISGRLVVNLADKIFEAGENKITWNAINVNAGIYFLQVQAGDITRTKKISVVK